MEDSEKVDIVEEKPEESEKLMEKSEEPAVASVENVTSQVSTSESIAEAPKSETDIPEVSESEAKTNSEEEIVKVEEKEVEIKIVEVKEAPKDPPIAIEECDTGGDEIPDVPNIPASIEPIDKEVEVETEAQAVPECEKSTEEPVLLAELTTFVPEQDQHVASSDNKPDSDVVALDDDDDDVEDAYDTHNIDDSEDPDDEDDEDVEGVSNEALNDDDEEVEEEDDEEYLYGAQESKNDKPAVKSSQEQIEPEEIDDEDDYDEDDDDDDRDDDDMIDLKDDSMGAVVIGSSDEDEPPVPKAKETPKPHSFSSQLSSSSQPQSKAILMSSRLQQSSAAVPAVGNTEDIELDYDEDDDEDDVDDDDDEYDDDDLMNAVVTSATKGGLSPPKKRPRSESPVAPIAAEARQREAHQISVLTRRINYGRIAKKKSLNWLYNKKKREAYKSILPKHKPRNHTEAMRSDQSSGGLLHLKISSPSVALIGQKAAINPSASTPIIARLESTPRPGPASRTKQNKHKSRDDIGVIDLDSSPEKTQDNIIHPRQQQSDDQRKLDFESKKSSSESSNKSDQDEGESTKMQQTDKVRDSIQKSTEEVEGVKSAQTEDRLKCEQNKENLQSNEALKKDSDDTTAVAMKVETEAKDASALPASTTPQEDMDTSETNESTMKATSVATSSLKVDIKEEKPDIETSIQTAVAADVAAASKVTIEDVPEREAIPSPHPVPVSANKRRRSSTAQDKSKTPKIVEPNQDTAGTEDNHRPDDDEEEYIHPTKKLREELQTAYPAHDRILNEYIEKTSNDSIDTIQRHIDQMVSEIHTLNDMIKAKEVEWNNMLHLKKVKEEIYFRLNRRKQCLEIMSTKVGETGVRSAGLDEDYHNILAGNESAIILGGTKNTPAKPNTMQQLSSTPIQAAINTLSCNFTTVSSSMSSTTAPTTAQLIIQNRANMKSSDLVKEKANTLRLHRLLVSRNILPKPTNTASPNASLTGHNHQQSPSTNGPTSTQPNASNQPILNSYLTSTDSVQQLVDMMNGHHNNHTSGLQNGGNAGNNSSQAAAAAAMVGRQGPFKDVRSIIADFRQQHPEVVPRRGRRNSRPSSNDSSSQGMSNQNQGATTNHNHSVNSFKDVLAPFSKSQGAVRSAGGQQQNPPYPEVTLHPVSTPLNASGGQDQPTGSLLHGILTKFSRPTESANTKSTVNQASANYISNFSPTLARLLTAPERISPSGTATGPNQSHQNSSLGIGNSDGGGGHHHSIPNFGVNLSKVVGHNSEITITPVMNSMHQQSILQQQLQQQQLKDVLTRAAAAVNASNSAKDEHFLKLSSFVTPSAPNNDDDAEDSVDRLVIDEGDLMSVGGEEHQKIAPHAIGQEFNENEVPVCQGCKKHEAQFVCAGCGNQWYCSRECQVTAWDDHSEVCTATKQIRNNFNMLKSRDLDKDEEYLIIRRRKKNKFLPQFY